ncbi:1,5-anhydro-D-fructose reductase-like [Planococcus citri]|uniref:1,5-anhydro-D-fructose reductase-like n=1 Tax=Planococcus citri TaxID=170843 RepID=UPI0031F902E5
MADPPEPKLTTTPRPDHPTKHRTTGHPHSDHPDHPRRHHRHHRDHHGEKTPVVILANGEKIPAIGLGTFRLRQPTETVELAIDIGYRLIDCGFIHQNESEVGAAINKKIREGVVERDDLFIIGKLWNTHHKPEEVIPAIERSLSDLCLHYFDAYLMQWPFASKKAKDEYEYCKLDEEHTPIEDTWCAMEELVSLGYTRMLGLSNFNSDQITQVLKISSVCPVINEIEVNPYFQNRMLSLFCKSRNIQVIAYAPLGSSDAPWIDTDIHPPIIDRPVILETAEKYNKDPGQIVLRYLHQLCVIPIPRSTDCDRLHYNFNIFDFGIDCIDHTEINTLETGIRTSPYKWARHFKEYPFHSPY